MNWYKSIKIASGSSIPYGYWLAPDGKRHLVGYQMHNDVAEELGFDGYRGAWDAGFYRVMTSFSKTYDGTMRGECGCEGRTPPTPEQASELIKIFTKETPCENAYVDAPGSSHGKWEARIPIKQVPGILRSIAKAAPAASDNANLGDVLGEPAPSPTAPAPSPTTPPQPAATKPAPRDVAPFSGGKSREEMMKARQQARARVNPLMRQ